MDNRGIQFDISVKAPNVEDQAQLENQRKLTNEFQMELITKLSKFSYIEASIHKFSLAYSKADNGQGSSNQSGVGFFADLLNLNKDTVNIDKEICACIDDILYPNVLDEHTILSDRNKMILCALIYDIQTVLRARHMPDMNADFSEDNVAKARALSEMIHQATRDAVATFLPLLDEYISSAKAQMKDSNSIKSSQKLTLGFLSKSAINGEQQPLIPRPQDVNLGDQCKCNLF